MLRAAPGYALDPAKRITQYIHTSWLLRDGAVPTAGYAIAQTSDGFLWFSSGDMLTFDGVRFTSWNGPPNGGSITNGARFGQIVQILGDRAGGLWVFGLHEVVHLKGRTVVSHFDLEGVRGLQNVVEDRDGSLWVVRGSTTVADTPLCHVTDRAVRCFGVADGIPISPLNSLMPDGAGGFWLGGQTMLVHWQDGAGEAFPIEALSSNAGQAGVAGLARGPDGTLWVGILAVGSGRGLGRVINGRFEPFARPGFDGSTLSVHSMLVDHDGNLWVATYGAGIYRIRGTTVDHFGRADGLSSDTVNVLFEDREGLLWAATPEGFDKFRDPAVASFTPLEGLGNGVPSGVVARADGSVWVANLGSLDRIGTDGSVSSMRTRDGLPGDRVTAMLEDRAGRLWVGVDESLYVFDAGRFRRIPDSSQSPLGMVAALAEDRDGDIWAECAGKPPKLVRIRDFQIRDAFDSARVPAGTSVAPDPEGGVWIRTTAGDLALFRDGVVNTFPLQTQPDPFTHRMVVTPDGTVVAGSADGLVFLRRGKALRLTTHNGLPCNFVTSFVEDRNHHWWLYTDCGIVDLPDAELQRWWRDPAVVVRARVYDELDGARGGRPGFNSAAYSADGRIWFVHGNFVLTLAPSQLARTAVRPTTHIQSVIVDRQEFLPTDRLALPARARDVEIDYTSPSLAIPQKVKFRYRLDGYDRDWHEPGTRRQAFYTDLPPRAYVFRVTASDRDGAWTGETASLAFAIAPMWYQTKWFYAIVAAAFLTLLWAAYALRLRRLAYQFNIRLEERVGERTRIARELHDTLLQSFQGLLLRFQRGINLLSTRPSEARTLLEEAVEQAERAIVEGREAITGLRNSTVEQNDLAIAVRAIGDELAASASDRPAPAFRVVVEGAIRNLHPILRDEVYRLASEAVRNAFTHAAARTIDVELRYEEKQFRLRVRDNGKGIGEAAMSGEGRSGHYGLHGMRERAELVGGTLTIWTEQNRGTEIALTVPAAKAYAGTRVGRSGAPVT